MFVYTKFDNIQGIKEKHNIQEKNIYLEKRETALNKKKKQVRRKKLSTTNKQFLSAIGLKLKSAK